MVQWVVPACVSYYEIKTARSARPTIVYDLLRFDVLTPRGLLLCLQIVSELAQNSQQIGQRWEWGMLVAQL